MRYIILVKASKLSEAGEMPSEDMLGSQVAYHAELADKGLLYDATGLKASSFGWRIHYSPEGERTMIPGPFPGSDDLVAGYTVIRVSSREEAIELTMRYPKPAFPGEEAEIEVREFFELDEFEQGPAIQQFREIGLIDRIAAAVLESRPDLGKATAPNGTVTILFTDIEGSTQLTESLGDREWMGLLREHNEIVRRQMTEHSGFEVKSQGDGFMLAFPSAREALRCAIAIQRALAARDSIGPELRVRVGLHTGEPVREADDFYGKAVILAARIAAEARGSEILVSSLVREITESMGEFSFEAPTDAELKGLSGMYHLSAVRWQT
jgi:class 3 adenylate cyclase